MAKYRQKDIMASTEHQIKQLTIRWPEDFWEAVSIEATKRRTSVQAIVTESVSRFLKIAAPKADAA